VPVRSLAFLGFSEQDTVLLRSLLTLGEPLLKETWVFSSPRDAEVVLADSFRSTEAELSGVTAAIVMVRPPGSKPTDLPSLLRPLRVSPLVALLNTFSLAPSPPLSETNTLKRPEKANTLEPTLSLATQPPPLVQKSGVEINVAGSESTPLNKESGKESKEWELVGWLRTRLNWKGTTKSDPLPIGAPPPLRLFAPIPRTFHNPSVELNERRIQKRINQLPLFNINTSVPHLIEALQGLSDEPIESRTRLQLLDLYREPINTLFRALGTPMLRKTSPVSGWEGSGSDPGQMFLACADGYKAVVLACRQTGNTPLADDLLLLGLWRALEQLAQALVHAYRYYRTLPPGVFLEAHQIFRYASYWGVENRPLRTTYPGLGTDLATGTASIADLYKQLLLLSISDPHSLATDHLNQVLEYLMPVAKNALLLKWKEAIQQGLVPSFPTTELNTSGRESLFIVDIEADHSPLSLVQTESFNATEDHWVINTQPVLTALYQGIINAAGEKAVLQRRLTEQLTTSLRGVSQRSEPRYPVKFEVILIFGLSEVHRELSGEYPSASRIKSNPWTVINENSKGLMLNSSIQYPIAVGEFVGVWKKLSTENGDWIVGVIRWLRTSTEGGIVLGIEMLTGSPFAIWCLFLEDNPQPGILQVLPGEDEEVVSVSKGFYRRDIDFELQHQGNSRRVVAGHLLHEESGFDQFALIALYPA